MDKIQNSKRLIQDRYLRFFWSLDIVFCDLFEIWCLRFVILNLVKPVYKCLKTYAQVLTSPLKYHDVKIYARVFRASSTLLLSLTMAEIA